MSSESEDEREMLNIKGRHDLLIKSENKSQNGFFKTNKKQHPMFPFYEAKIKFDDYGEIIRYVLTRIFPISVREILKIFEGRMFLIYLFVCVLRPEDYKMTETNLEVEENKENVDGKDDDIAGRCTLHTRFKIICTLHLKACTLCFQLLLMSGCTCDYLNSHLQCVKKNYLKNSNKISV